MEYRQNWDLDFFNFLKNLEKEKPVIVCGDFNCPPGSAEYQYIIENSDLSDCWQLIDPVNHNISTLKHGKTEDIDISGKIDHIFVSADLVDRVQGVTIDHQAEGSDHKPVRCRLG